MKPYYRSDENWRARYVTRFHGLKPSDFLEFWLSGTCQPIKCCLLFRFQGAPFQCASLQDWAPFAFRPLTPFAFSPFNAFRLLPF